MPQSISDQDLLRRSLFSSNPLEEPNLVQSVPHGVELVGILSAYEHRAFRLPCAECGAARHYKGFVVELSNGKRTLLGNHCGRKLFGDGWDIAGRIFHALVDRQALLRRREKLLPRLPALIALAQDWGRRMAEPSAVVQETRRRFPLLMDRLRERIEKSDGILTIDRVVAGTGGERVETVSLGKVAGAAAIYLPMHERKIAVAVQLLAKAKHGLEADNLQTRALEMHLRAIADAAQVLREAAAACAAVETFFARTNVRMMSQWAMSMPALEKTLKLKDGRVVAQWKETVLEEREATIERIRVIGVPRHRKKKKHGPEISRRLRREIEEAERTGRVRALVNRHPGLLSIWQERKRLQRPVAHLREGAFPWDVTGPPIDPKEVDAILNA